MAEGPPLDEAEITLVTTWEDACRFKEWLGGRRSFLGVDVETTGLNVGRDRIRLAQFGDHAAGFAFPYDDWRGLVREAIQGYRAPMVAHNLIFDSKMLRADGATIPQRWANCTLVMAFLDNPAAKVGLKSIAARLVDRRAASGQQLLGQAMSAGRWDWSTIPVDHPAYWAYGALDTCLTSMVADKLWERSGGGSEFKRAYDLEMACIHALREAEIAGLQTDPDYRRAATARLEAEVAALRPQIPIRNPGSDKQVIEYLQGLGAKLTVRTEAGNLSVDKEVLRWLAPEFPVAALIEEYRSKSRMLSSYFRKMDELEAPGGRVHCSTKPVGARHGRMSVTDPALQTLPRGRLVRDAFVAGEGRCLVMADFKAQEMRALASLAREPAMLAAFARGEDLHNFVAEAAYGASFTKGQRQVCKSAGFAKIFGAGVEKFAVTAGIPVPEAAAFLDRYDGLFPGVRAFQAATAGQIVERAGSYGRRGKMGWVELIDGRRIPVEADKAYKGVNYIISGSCAISTKEKIVELDNRGLGQFFRLAVHDELIFEVPDEHVPTVLRIIEDVMPDRHNFPGVTMEIETDVVRRWGAHYPEAPKYVDMGDDVAWEEAGDD